MKLSPFAIFLLLLIIFIFVILMSKTMKLKDIYGNSVEGFNAYSNMIAIDPAVSVPPYSTSKSITLLYDNIYFDETNGNIIKIYGSSLQAPTQIVVIQRNGVISFPPIVDANTQVVDNSISNYANIDDTYTSWTYPKSISSVLGSSDGTIINDAYQIFYMPYGDATAIHIINVVSKMNIGTFYFCPSSKIRSGYQYSNMPITLQSTPVTDNDPNNNSIIYENYYDQQNAGYVYQISQAVFFDPFSGNLGIRNMTGGTAPRIQSLNMYDRINGTNTIYSKAGNYLNINATIPLANSWKPWMTTDTYGNNMVLYMPTQQSTIVAIFSYDPSDTTNKSLLKLNNVCRFNSNGDIDYGNGLNVNTQASNMNNYYNQFWYNNATAGMGGIGSGLKGSDYMLKTQVVPPVCPSCPNCILNVGSGACPSCGNTPGSSTVTNTNASTNTANANVVGSSTTPGNLSSAQFKMTVGSNGLTMNTNERYNTVPQGNPDSIVGGVGNVANNMVSTTGNVLSDVVSAANINQVVSDAITTTGGVLNTGISTLGGSVNNVVDKTAGILTPGNWNVGQNYNQQGVVSTQQGGVVPQQGTWNQGAYSTGAVGTWNPQMGYNTRTPQSQQTGYPNSAINGIVSSKPSSNFIPITADFSNFSK